MEYLVENSAQILEIISTIAALVIAIQHLLKV